MHLQTRVLLSPFGLLVAGVVCAQVPFPPPALLSAASFAAVSSALGVANPEFSSYLLLDVPEVSTAGTVRAIVQSELPGTTQLVLVREFPVTADREAAPPAKPSSKPAGTRTAPLTASVRSPKPPTVFIAAKQVKPGETARFEASFEFDRKERFTVLAFAQGRWFGAAREIKLARKVSERP